MSLPGPPVLAYCAVISITTDSAAQTHMVGMISPIRPVAALISTKFMKSKATPVQTSQEGSE